MTTTYKLSQYRQAADILQRHADAYPEDGPVGLTDETLDQVADDLRHVPLELLQELDETPYEFLSYEQASRIQWFGRRFRNSGGWQRLYPEDDDTFANPDHQFQD